MIERKKRYLPHDTTQFFSIESSFVTLFILFCLVYSVYACNFLSWWIFRHQNSCFPFSSIKTHILHDFPFLHQEQNKKKIKSPRITSRVQHKRIMASYSSWEKRKTFQSTKEELSGKRFFFHSQINIIGLRREGEGGIREGQLDTIFCKYFPNHFLRWFGFG